jgi:general secretion pathway protein I
MAENVESGFTLVEAMVALAIVALGMMAVNTQLNRYAVTTLYVEQKTLASWIASNRLTELSVSGQWPELGRSEEPIEFAGQDWIARVEVSETPVANLRRVDVAVVLASNPDSVIHHVSTLLEPPPPAGFLPVQWVTPGGGAEG